LVAAHSPGKLAAPRIRPVKLSHLADAEAEVLEDEENHEGLRWAGTSFADRSLRGLSFVGCEFDAVELADADLTAARFSDCRLTRLNLPVLTAPDASWVGSEIVASRIGAWEGYGANLRAVRVDECKITYANLRGAALTDVLFSHCTFDELDLMDVSGLRVSFVDCSIGVLTAHRTKIGAFDLRGASIGAVSGMEGLTGATISADQVSLLAPQFAEHLGINVE